MKPKEHLKSLTTGQRRRLNRYCCGLCDAPLTSNVCQSVYQNEPYPYKCDDEKIITRREECLKEYKPRVKK